MHDAELVIDELKLVRKRFSNLGDRLLPAPVCRSYREITGERRRYHDVQAEL